MPLISALGLAALACEGSLPASTLDAAFGEAVDAWTGFDLPGLQQAAGDLDAELPCVREVLGPSHVASYWRVQALAGFARGDLEGTELALARARQVQPSYVLPTSLVPTEHPLRLMWDSAATAPVSAPRRLEPPVDGWLHVDGRRASEAPDQAPYLFQWLDGGGVVGSTARVPAGQTPVYPLPEHHSRTLALAGAVTAAVAGGAFGGAAALRDHYRTAPATAGPLTGVRDANRVLVGGGAALGALAAGFGIGALVVGEW